ncbi:hypothetical protein KR018_007433 [Drosophila ironensis]|nr:hypothetical protein KR018_007433 [Drosophila ironensis]
MPRCYQKATRLAHLSAQKRLPKAKADPSADSESDADDPEEISLAGSVAEPSAEEKQAAALLQFLPHATVPAANTGMVGQHLHDLEDEEEGQLYPSVLVSLPVPLFAAHDGRTPRLEICTQRPHAYEEHMRQLGTYRSLFDKRTKAARQRETKEQHSVHDGNVFDMAEHIARRGDMYFREGYDYYYTGGNLSVLPFQGSSLAMHVSGPGLQDLHFSMEQGEAEVLKPLYSTSLREASSEIFQLLPLKRDGFFLARCLKDVFICELEDRADDLQLAYRSKFSIAGAAPFISAAQGRGSVNTLALASQDRALRFVDLETKRDIASHDVCLLKGLHQSNSTWAQLLAADENTFHYLSQPVLLTVDARCDQPLNPCFASSVHSLSCERFSCLAKGSNSNLLYVASNHKLHCLDLRCLGKKLEERAVVTWTHQMSYPPLFMDCLGREDSEFIALGGALPGDLRICELRGVQATVVDEMFSAALPFEPPNFKEALAVARLRRGLDVYADLGERVKSCMTGLRIHKLKRTTSDYAFAQLLTANSLGDVYCQRMCMRESEELDHEIRTGLHTDEVVKYYESLVRMRVEPQKLHCTQVQKVPEIRDIMREGAKAEDEEKPAIIEEIEIDYGIEDTDESAEEGEESADTDTSREEKLAKKKLKDQIKQNASHKRSRGISRGPWQKSAYKLSRYRDMLSVRLLEAWDMEEYEQTRDVTREMLQERLEDNLEEPEKRTVKWLDELLDPPQPPADDDKDNPLVPGTSLQKLYEATTADYKEILPNFEVAQPSILMPGQNTIIENEIRTPPAKKPKYTMGF